MKRYMALLSVPLLAGTLAACGTAPGGAKTSSGPVTLWDTQVAPYKNVIQSETHAFNKANPKQPPVNPVWFSNNPYKQKLRIAMGSGNGPTIYMNFGGGILDSYVKAGDAYNLSSALSNDPAWKSRFMPYVWSEVTFGGKIYGIPYTGSTPAFVFYNKSIFAKYGLSVPKTWPQFIHVISVLKAHGVTPISLGGKDQWSYLYLTELISERLAGAAPYNAMVKGSSSVWGSHAMMADYTDIQKLVKMGAFEPGFTEVGTNNNQAEQLFTQGHAAMQVLASWAYGRYQSVGSSTFMKHDLGWFRFPSMPGSGQNSYDQVGLPADYYSINPHASKAQIKEAVSYLKHVALNSSEVKASLSKLGSVPGVAGVSSAIQTAPASSQSWLAYQNSQLKKAPVFEEAWDQALGPVHATALLDNLSKLFALQITPQQMATNMEAVK